ncbi:MAG: hypothetical protein WC451_03120 [Patescibacteria group bacterium]|jgi:hypothetical protein
MAKNFYDQLDQEASQIAEPVQPVAVPQAAVSPVKNDYADLDSEAELADKADYTITAIENMGLAERGFKQYLNKTVLEMSEQSRPTSVTVDSLTGMMAAAKEMEPDLFVPSEGGLKKQKRVSFMEGLKAVPKIWWAITKGYYGKKGTEDRIAAHNALKEERGSYEFDVPAAESFGEYAVDIGAGIGAFMTQLAIAKKIIPPGTVISDTVAWEMINRVNGGKPGEGVAMHAAFSSAGVAGEKIVGKIPGKKLIAKVARGALGPAPASIAMGGVAAAGGASPTEIAIQAGIPYAHAGIKGIKSTIGEAKLKRTIGKKTGEVKLTPEPELTISPEEQRIKIIEHNRAVSKWIEAGKPEGKKPVLPDLGEAPKAKTEGFEDVRTKINTGLSKAKKIAAKLVKPGQKAERIQRAAAFEKYKGELVEKGVPVSEALKQAKSKLKGPLLEQQPKYEPPKLETQQWEKISEEIDRSGKFQTYEKIRAQNAVENKLRNGQPLQDNEIELLSRIFGPEFVKAARRVQPWQAKAWRNFEEVMNFWKIGASFDIQMRRQARWLRGRHPVMYAKAVGKNVAGYFSTKAADKIRFEYSGDPLHKQAKADGVVFLEPPGRLSDAVPVGQRIEFFRTALPSKIKGVGRLYKASQRGFVESFNWMQQKLYNYKIDQWHNSGRQISPEMRADLADFNNTLLGFSQPKTDFGAKARRTLSVAMWSPTLTWSRIRTPSMIFSNKAMRTEVATTMASYIGTGLMMMYAAKRFGGFEVEFNPQSTDFGKVKIKNTRFDVFGDGGPYIRALVQFVSGQKKTSTGKIIDYPRGKTLTNFLRNKRSAFIDFTFRMITGESYAGQKIWELPEWDEVKKKGSGWVGLAKLGEKMTATEAGKIAFFGGREIVNTFAPFFMEASVEAMYNDGIPIGLLAGTEEFFSGTTLSYKPTKAAELQMLKDSVADLHYNKNWEDLGQREQIQLNRRYSSEFEQMGLEARRERAKRTDYEFVGKVVEESKEAGQNVYKKLDKNLQKAMKDANVPGDIIGLSRRAGKWSLNDTRYERYQTLTAERLNEILPKLFNSKSWSRLSETQKTERIKDMITTAKTWSRRRLVKESGSSTKTK